MAAYLLKRVLLIFPTMLGIMLISFCVIQFAPGGPIERIIAQLSGTEVSATARIGGGQGDGIAGQSQGPSAGSAEGSKYRGAQGLDPQFLKSLEKQFGFDKPAHERFLLMIRNYLVFDFGQSYFRSVSVISLIKSRSVDLASVGSAAGLNTTPDKTGKTNYWIEGVASFGTRDASGGIASSEFSSNGISIGMDRRLNDDLALGLGVGYARDKSTFGTDGSANKAKGYSLAAYGSYQLSPNTYLDGLLGVGSLDFATRRFVAPANDFALGNRSGTQLFGSLTGGYENAWNWKGPAFECRSSAPAS